MLARRYRVLMIAPTSFFADYGCHVRILEETRALQQLGHQVAICTYHNGRNLPEVRTLRTLSIPWRSDYEVGSSRHKIAFDALLFVRCLRAVIETRPHVLHAHLHEGALIGLVLSRLFGIPLVFDFQGSLTGEMVDHQFLNPAGPYYRPLLRLERWIDRSAAHVLTSSTRARDLLTGEFGCSPERILSVPDCVNTAVFQPFPRDQEWQSFKRSLGIPGHRKVIMYLGLLAEYQGTSHLLQAARRVCAQRDDVHFVIAGYPHIARYQRLAEELGVAERVTFPGLVRYEQAPRVLSVGDIAVAPKLSRTEGAGKLLNYMAMAMPTVAYDTPVSREYLAEQGVYARYGDSEHLAECLLELLEDEPQRQELGRALRERAGQHYTWEGAARNIVALYDDLVRGA